MRWLPRATFSLKVVDERGAVDTDAYIHVISSKEINPAIVDESAVRLDREIHLSFMFGILGMSELKKFREKGYRNSKRFTGMPKESNRLRNALTFERLAKYSSRYL